VTTVQQPEPVLQASQKIAACSTENSETLKFYPIAADYRSKEVDMFTYDLEAILSHPYVTQHKAESPHRPACAHLWRMKRGHVYWGLDALQTILTDAYMEGAPIDFRNLILSYLITHYGSLALHPGCINLRKDVYLARRQRQLDRIRLLDAAYRELHARIHPPGSQGNDDDLSWRERKGRDDAEYELFQSRRALVYAAEGYLRGCVQLSYLTGEVAVNQATSTDDLVQSLQAEEDLMLRTCGAPWETESRVDSTTTPFRS
jgi:hypothetical protein